MEVAGRVADGEDLTREALEQIARDGDHHGNRAGMGSLLLNAVQVSAHPYRWPVEERVKWIMIELSQILGKGAMAIQCHLLRDIFGNPFRPVAFSPSWRTDTAVSLAGGMYESRDFGAMPILADALQDAGCDNEDVLNHCRDAKQVHVRGCWVVDLVLGKG